MSCWRTEMLLRTRRPPGCELQHAAREGHWDLIRLMIHNNWVTSSHWAQESLNAALSHLCVTDVLHFSILRFFEKVGGTVLPGHLSVVLDAAVGSDSLPLIGFLCARLMPAEINSRCHSIWFYTSIFSAEQHWNPLFKAMFPLHLDGVEIVGNYLGEMTERSIETFACCAQVLVGLKKKLLYVSVSFSAHMFL
jgi:hypothetical protein